jgi:hypothetical protein
LAKCHNTARILRKERFHPRWKQNIYLLSEVELVLERGAGRCRCDVVVIRTSRWVRILTLGAVKHVDSILLALRSIRDVGS